MDALDAHGHAGERRVVLDLREVLPRADDGGVLVGGLGVGEEAGCNGNLGKGRRDDFAAAGHVCWLDELDPHRGAGLR